MCGAGMRQKSIEMYNAEHLFVELNLVMGEREVDTVTYYIPREFRAFGGGGACVGGILTIH